MNDNVDKQVLHYIKIFEKIKYTCIIFVLNAYRSQWELAPRYRAGGSSFCGRLMKRQRKAVSDYPENVTNVLNIHRDLPQPGAIICRDRHHLQRPPSSAETAIICRDRHHLQRPPSSAETAICLSVDSSQEIIVIKNTQKDSNFKTHRSIIYSD